MELTYDPDPVPLGRRCSTTAELMMDPPDSNGYRGEVLMFDEGDGMDLLEWLRHGGRLVEAEEEEFVAMVRAGFAPGPCCGPRRVCAPERLERCAPCRHNLLRRAAWCTFDNLRVHRLSAVMLRSDIETALARSLPEARPTELHAAVVAMWNEFRPFRAARMAAGPAEIRQAFRVAMIGGPNPAVHGTEFLRRAAAAAKQRLYVKLRKVARRELDNAIAVVFCGAHHYLPTERHTRRRAGRGARGHTGTGAQGDHPRTCRDAYAAAEAVTTPTLRKHVPRELECERERDTVLPTGSPAGPPECWGFARAFVRGRIRLTNPPSLDTCAPLWGLDRPAGVGSRG